MLTFTPPPAAAPQAVTQARLPQTLPPTSPKQLEQQRHQHLKLPAHRRRCLNHQLLDNTIPANPTLRFYRVFPQ